MTYYQDWKRARATYDTAYQTVLSLVEDVEADLKTYPKMHKKVLAPQVQTHECFMLLAGDQCAHIKVDIGDIKGRKRPTNLGVGKSLDKLEDLLGQLEEIVKPNTAIQVDDWGKTATKYKAEMKKLAKALTAALTPILLPGFGLKSKSVKAVENRKLSGAIAKLANAVEDIQNGLNERVTTANLRARGRLPRTEFLKKLEADPSLQRAIRKSQ